MAGWNRLLEFARSSYALGPSIRARAAILWRQTKNVRVRLGIARYRPHGIYTLDTTFGRLHFRDNFGDITNLPNLLYREVYRLPRPAAEGVILDVGANIGLAAVWFTRCHPGRPVHCFEPLVENARMIERNCAGARVTVAAVGATPDAITLDVDRDAVMATSIPWQHASGRRSVDVITLDDYVRREGLERVAVLKLDVEGMELDVLRGAATTLARTDQVAMESHGRDRHVRALDALSAAGFDIARETFDGQTGLIFAVRPSGVRG